MLQLFFQTLNKTYLCQRNSHICCPLQDFEENFSSSDVIFLCGAWNVGHQYSSALEYFFFYCELVSEDVWTAHCGCTCRSVVSLSRDNSSVILYFSSSTQTSWKDRKHEAQGVMLLHDMFLYHHQCFSFILTSSHALLLLMHSVLYINFSAEHKSPKNTMLTPVWCKIC